MIPNFKPSWEDAPKWANYLAQDADGCWYWYECEPFANNKGCWESDEGRHELAQYWLETKEERPKT